LVFVMCGSAWAGRPLNTDDAAILPEGGCQLETWLRRARDLHEIVVQPACNPWGGVEWGAVFASTRPVDRSTQSSLGVQGKTVFKEVQTGGWGAGLTIGATRHADGDVAGTTRMGTLIFSGAPSDALMLHANLGVAQAPARSALANWAAAVEYSVIETWTLVAESYGERHGRPTLQIGARTWLRPETVQLDATLGREHVDGRHRSFITVGMVWNWGAPASASAAPAMAARPRP